MFIGVPLYPIDQFDPTYESTMGFNPNMTMLKVERVHDDTVDDPDSANAWEVTHTGISTLLFANSNANTYWTDEGLNIGGVPNYSGSETYELDDLVIVPFEGNSVYQCISSSPVTGSTPSSNPSDWSLLAQFGYQGYDDNDEYDASVTYDEGDVVFRRGFQFTSVQGSNLGNNPLTDVDGTWWLNSGSIRTQKPFNQSLTDRFESTTAGAAYRWTFVPNANGLDTGVLDFKTFDRSIDAVGFFNLYAGTIRLRLTHTDDGVVYDQTVGLIDDGYMDDWYDYFFMDVRLFKEHLFIDIPQYPNGEVAYEAWIVPPGANDGVAVGEIELISANRIGDTVFGTSLSYKDYSRKDTDQFGNFTFTQRPVSLVVDYDFVMDTAAIRYARTLVTDNRAKNAVFYAVDDDQTTGTLVFGRIARELEINLSGPNKSRATLSVESLAT